MEPLARVTRFQAGIPNWETRLHSAVHKVSLHRERDVDMFFATSGTTRKRVWQPANAGIAQLVEQLICNQQVVGSNPTAGSFNFRLESLAVASHPLQAIADFRLG
jgi:hypothetical protein